MRLVYFADPLCSWCYGFGPELAKALEARPEMDVELVMGGLRPFNREPATDAFRRTILDHWAHVAQATGLPFCDAALSRPGFVYDTEPACRAVVVAAEMDPRHALACMKGIQNAFYRDGRDATQVEVLADAAGAAGYDREDFLARMDSPEARHRTQQGFMRSQALGVRGFPTVAAARGNQLHLVTAGFTDAATLLARLAAIEEMAA